MLLTIHIFYSTTFSYRYVQFIDKLIYHIKIKVITSLFTAVAFIITLTLSIADVTKLIKEEKDISGEWNISNTIRATSLKRYEGLKLGYKVCRK